MVSDTRHGEGATAAMQDEDGATSASLINGYVEVGA